MKNILTLLIFFGSLGLYAQTKTFVIIGDSLTEGYGVARESAFPALLQEKIQAQEKSKWKVINSGISGATTASAIGRVNWVLKSKPDLVMLILGANDGLRGLKVAESQKNLEEALELLKKNKVKTILGGLYMPPNYGKEYSNQFKAMYAALSKKHNVPLVPFILDSVAGNPKYNLADGIHPNEEGHKIIANKLYEKIKEHL